MECRKSRFSKFGGLGGDFYKGTQESKMIVMHIGSVLNGLEAGNVNTDAKISIVGYGDVWRGVKKILETLEGTFVRQHVSQRCLGCILEVF